MLPSPQAWFHSPHISPSPPIIISGCNRSGTTLLRVILDTHSQIAHGPESQLLLQPLEFSSQGKQLLSTNFDIPQSTITQLNHQSHSHAEFIDLFLTTTADSTKNPSEQ